MLMCEYEPIPRGQGVQGDQTIFTMRHWISDLSAGRGPCNILHKMFVYLMTYNMYIRMLYFNVIYIPNVILCSKDMK